MKVYRKIRKSEAKPGPLHDILISNDPIWRVHAYDEHDEYIYETESQNEAEKLFDRLLLGEK